MNKVQKLHQNHEKVEKWWSPLSRSGMPPRSRVPISLATSGSAKLMKRLRIIAASISTAGMRAANNNAKPPSVTPTAPGRGKVETAT